MPLTSATSRPQTRQIASVSTASSTVTLAPSSNAGIRRAMKCGSNGTSVFVVIVEALRRRVLLQPLMVPFDIFLVTGAGTQFADPGVEKEPPFKIARFQKNRVLEDNVRRRPRDVEAHQVLVFALVIVGDRLVDPEGGGAPGLDREKERRRRIEQ